ncbi:MAG: hypothetical protein ACYS0G_10770 [Planctomycetota bacterium]|jgi:hypothetical protein
MNPRRLGKTLLGTTAGNVLLFSTMAPAQPGQHQMMVVDDGSGPMVMHFSPPDIRGLRTPDFVRRDLPTFNEKLQLDLPQRVVVRTLLDLYLSDFEAVADEHLPAGSRPGRAAGDRLGPEVGFAGPRGAIVERGGEGQGIDGLVLDALKGADELSDLDIDVEGPGRIAVTIEATAGGPEGPEPEGAQDIDVIAEADPEAEVVISVAGPDDAPLPEALRKQLEEKAKAMADRIKEQMEQNEAEGLDPLAGAEPAFDRMEERRRHFEELAERAAKLKRAKAELKQNFISDVQAQLSAEQLELWPGLERTLTRRKTLPRGRLDGERTDLVAVIDGLGLDEAEREAVAERLETYEMALHDALVQRNDFLEDADTNIDKALRDGKSDKALSIVDRATALRVAVRGTNQQFTEAIAQRLSNATARPFRRKVLEASYPRVYRRTSGQQAFEAVRRLDGLDEGVMPAVVELEAAYTAELGAVNERIRRTIEKHQPRETRRSIERMQSMLAGPEASFDEDDDPIRTAFRKRRKLDERYMKQLYGMLTPDQVSALPKLPSQRRREPIVIHRSSSPD